jgi:hypothetical protein
VTAIETSSAIVGHEIRRQHGVQGSACLLSRRDVAIFTLVSALFFYFLATHGGWDPGYEQPLAGFDSRFFLAQAQAMVHGHLAVPPAQLTGECYVHAGRCYGYFGLTPSLLRVPLLPLLDLVNRAATPEYIALALSLAVGSMLGIASVALSGVRRTRTVLAITTLTAFALGPASILVPLTRPAVYEEAIAWSVAFALLAIYAFLRWWRTPRNLWGVVLVVSLVLSTNSRPTTLLLGVTLGAGIVIRALRSRSASPLRRPLSLGAATALLPMLTCFGVYWLKFRQLIPSLLLNEEVGGPTPAPWWLSLRHINHGTLQGIRFIPTALVAYLRPDGLAFGSSFPFIDFRVGPTAGTHFFGIPPGSMFVERFSTIPDDMPGIVVLVVLGAVVALRRRTRTRSDVRSPFARLADQPMIYCLLGTAGAWGLTLTSVTITNRYLGDAFPLIALCALVALGSLLGPFTRLPGRNQKAIVAVAAVAVVYSLVVNTGLAYQLWWNTAA